MGRSGKLLRSHLLNLAEVIGLTTTFAELSGADCTMPLSTKLDRNLRAAESSDNESYYEVSDRSSPSIVDGNENDELVDSSSDEGSDDDQVQQQLSKVSFGALLKAQDAISQHNDNSRKRKRGEDTSASQEDKLQALRERLREVRAQKEAEGPKHKPKTKASSKTQRNKKDLVEDEEEVGEGDNDSSDSDSAPRARSSKHAPTVQSSKRAVTRRRNVIEVKKPVARDPRFDPAAGSQPDEHILKKRYAFLEDYKALEMAELKAAIRKTKNEEDKEKLKRKLLSMESQKKAQETKDRQQAIKREHKKKEKELIKEGKAPFYLKKSEQKKLALVDRFQNMKSKDRDRAIERRRKKVASKERRNMPAERRAER